MAEILVAGLSPAGHIGPLLKIAQDLVGRGHRVTVMTGARHADTIRGIGARQRLLPPEADFDRSPFDSVGRTTGITTLREAITRVFLAPMPHQAAELSAATAETRFDAVVADYWFLGIIPLLLGDPASRPPVLLFMPTPLTLSSRDTAPWGMGMAPLPGLRGRLRNGVLNLVAQRVTLRSAQRDANAILGSLGVSRLPVSLPDVGELADRLIVPTVPSFEYPRTDLPRNVRFVGAVHPRSCGYLPPQWRHELDDDRPVVHVTDRSVNDDVPGLTESTIEALAGENVLVVATTGGGRLTGSLPGNVRVAERVPYEALLEHVDVMVTDGSYVAVQRALSTGVPLVVAGAAGYMQEVAARVAWSGAGVNLKTPTPTQVMIRDAVRDVLDEERYLRRARELESAFTRRDGIAEITALVGEVVGARRTSPGQRVRSRE